MKKILFVLMVTNISFLYATTVYIVDAQPQLPNTNVPILVKPHSLFQTYNEQAKQTASIKQENLQNQILQEQLKQEQLKTAKLQKENSSN